MYIFGFDLDGFICIFWGIFVDFGTVVVEGICIFIFIKVRIVI